jgi:GNAT superfamily N-acetyltransferase
VTAQPVRPAAAADIPELVRVINAAYRVEDFFIDGDRTSAAEVDVLMARPEAGFLAIPAADPPALVAGAYVERRATGLYFAMLSVDPPRQGQGHARRLVEAIERHAEATGCDALEIEVVNLREELPAFYDRMGFVATGVSPFPGGVTLKRPAHLVLMRKRVRR